MAKWIKKLSALNKMDFNSPVEHCTKVELKDRTYFMPSFLPSGKAGELQILCWQGFAVNYYDFTLAAVALEPSDFCSNGVTQ